MTGDRGQMMAESNSNEKLLRGVQGGGFLEKSPPGNAIACFFFGGMG